jgi:DNA-binding MarR family transcriptional regulator
MVRYSNETAFCCLSSANNLNCLPNAGTGHTLTSMESGTKPPDTCRSREQEAVLGLLRTAEAIRRTLAQVIEPHGITPQQYNVLRILRGAGPDGLPTLTIGERMIEQTPGITRLIDRLERKGLVTRTPCPKDRRRVYCRISDSGLELLAGLDEPINRWDSQAISVLDPSDIDSLIAALDRVRAFNS